MKPFALLLPLIFLFWGCSSDADRVQVAVAANFVEPMRVLAQAYPHRQDAGLQIISGASGKLYAQITHGAPFDLFFSADTDKPARLHAQGMSSPPQVYAQGSLALWSTTHADLPEVLTAGHYKRLAIANPVLAPYGVAAQQVLEALNIPLDERLVYGENISQTFQFVYSGSADAGLIAFSQTLRLETGHVWPVPRHLHKPIRQAVVHIVQTEQSPHAQGFLNFVMSEAGQRIIEEHGYQRAGA